MELTVPEAAARLGRSPETLRRWIRAGKLPSRKVGTQHLIREEDLAGFAGLETAERVAESATPYFADVPDDDAELRKLRRRITMNPQILVGKPTIHGMRISVEMILELLGGGWSMQEVLDNYPSLDEDDLRACFIYAADVVSSERVFPLRAGR